MKWEAVVPGALYCGAGAVGGDDDAVSDYPAVLGQTWTEAPQRHGPVERETHLPRGVKARGEEVVAAQARDAPTGKHRCFIQGGGNCRTVGKQGWGKR